MKERRSGKIKVPNRQLSNKPGETTIGADIIFLQSVLNWATTKKQRDGTSVLERNPIQGCKRPRNRYPRRPVATYDRYVAVRDAAHEVDPQGLFGMFMDLHENLGWRVSAICQIKASDVNLKSDKQAPHGRLRKRGEVDKEGVEMEVPLSEVSAEALRTLVKLASTSVDAPLFPSPKNHTKPWTRWHARDLLERAEQKAKLQPLEGGDFHPYRRKWATERKHLPDTDVAAAGGWRDLRSLQLCYQQVDDETLLQVMTEPRKLRDTSNSDRDEH